MTLMTWGNSEGTKGRCDAKCHNATTDKCTCMCGGHYHGAGRDGTLARKVNDFGNQILKAATKRANAEHMTLRAPIGGKLLTMNGSMKDLPLFKGA